MSALYSMRYAGDSGAGAGALYIGRGKILGADVANGRYEGSYEEVDGELVLTAELRMVEDGLLVTGRPVPKGTVIPLKARWPIDFADGQPRQIDVAGETVVVRFEKVGDIP